MNRCLIALAMAMAACDEGGDTPDSGAMFVRDTGTSGPDAGQRDAGGAQIINVQSVFDGDTIRVGASFSLFTPDNKPLAGEAVRFLGIDAPEIAHPPAPADCWGPEAAQYARDLLQGRTITLEFDLEPSCTLPIAQNQAERCHLRDGFGRLLAYVHLADDRVANELLITDGMARSFRSFPHRDTAKYNTLERAAQTARRGLWTCP